MAAIIFSSAFINKAKAQTADSAFTITDTSVTTATNIVVTDSSGHTTLFAGGQQSNFNGKVGVGTAAPNYKLTVYDDAKANFRLSQKMKPDTTHHSQLRGIRNGILGNNGQPIENFDIDFVEPTGNNLFTNGDVLLSTNMPGMQPVDINNCSVAQEIIDRNGLLPEGDGEQSCDIYQGGKQMYIGTAFGWLIPTCNNYIEGLSVGTNAMGRQYFNVDAHAYFRRDLLVNGATTINNKATINGNTSVTGGDFVVYAANSVNPLLKLNQADQTLYARAIQVQTTAFPDYVFDANYHLMGLHEVENYIAQNHHLPQMPTACEAEANGVNVADMQNKLLQKIEELTLYMVQQQKQIEDLKAQVENNKH